jgi:hypothetical protein
MHAYTHVTPPYRSCGPLTASLQRLPRSFTAQPLSPCAAARAPRHVPRVVSVDVVLCQLMDGGTPVEPEVAVALRLELLPVEPGQLAVVAVPVVVAAARVRVLVACDAAAGPRSHDAAYKNRENGRSQGNCFVGCCTSKLTKLLHECSLCKHTRPLSGPMLSYSSSNLTIAAATVQT